ncbi:MAG: EamA family transporter, partial [Elusimicrobiota bacterium]
TFRGLSPRTVLLGVYGLFAYHFCLFMALRLAPPVETSLLNYLWPLLMVALAPVLLPECALKPRHLAGVLLGFGGVILLVAGETSGPLSGHAAGYGLAVAAAFIWASYSLLTKRFGGSGTAGVSACCLISGALSLACHAAFEPRYAFVAADAASLLALGLGPLGVSFYLWDRAVKEGDPRAIATLAYLTPLLSTAWLTLFGGGRLTLASAAAAALIVGGAVVGSR